MDQRQRDALKRPWAAIIMLLVLSLHGAAGQITLTTAAASTTPTTTSTTASTAATTASTISTTAPASTSATTTASTLASTSSTGSSTTATGSTTTGTGSTTTVIGSTTTGTSTTGTGSTTTTTRSTATSTSISVAALGAGLKPWEIAVIVLAAVAVGILLFMLGLMCASGMFSSMLGGRCSGSYNTTQVQPTCTRYEMGPVNCNDRARQQQC